MKLKSYFASTVEAAIALATRDLGDDALLIYSREASPETRYLGRYEVVFAEPQEEALAPTASAGASAPRKPATGLQTDSGFDREPGMNGGQRAALPLVPSPPSAPPERWKQFEQMLDRMRDQLERQSARIDSLLDRGESIARPVEATDAPPAQSEVRLPERPTLPGEPQRVAALARRLRLTDIPDSMAREMAMAAARAVRLPAPREPGMPEDLLAGPEPFDEDTALAEELAARLPSGDASPGQRAGHGLLVVVGPAGAGKTSLAVKLAGRHILAGGPPPLLASLGDSRVGESQELEAYARLLGARHSRITDPAQWRRPAGLSIVDAAAWGPATTGHAVGLLERFLSAQEGIELHLVLPATMRTGDMSPLIELALRFAPNRVAFTRLDETKTYGPIWAASRRMGAPVSFLSGGRRIPEDLLEASGHSIARLVLGASLDQIEVSERQRPKAAAAGVEGGQ
ncbi:MAG: hypothetical protein U0Q16_39135 [Bryobacteraceae bacterium]